MDTYPKVIQILTQNMTPDELVAFFEQYDGDTLDFHAALAKAVFAVRPGIFADPPNTLDSLTAEFDAMLDDMQAPERQAAMAVAFRASPEQLGAAAVEGAKKRKPTTTRGWMEAIARNPEELLRYVGKHVAVDPTEGVIDSDESMNVLYERMRSRGLLGQIVFDTV